MVENKRQIVAVVDSAELPAETCFHCLSAGELAVAAGFGNRRRRDEWIAGRMAAKFVFLRCQLTDLSDQPDRLVLWKVSPAELAGFAPSVYQKVATIRDESPGGGPARIGWDGSSDTTPVAISHVNGIACALIGSAGESCSIDMEASAPRVPAFYIQNFTLRERTWADSCASSSGLGRDWLYTLLWSAKECLLKTTEFSKLSLWDMPSLGVHIAGSGESLKTVYDAGHLGGSFQFLQTEIAPSGKQLQLAVSGNADLVFTAITRLDQKTT